MMNRLDFAAKFKGNGEKKETVKYSAIFLFVCGICPMTVAATFCGLYWGMWGQAMNVNDLAEENGYDNGDIPAYDTCGISQPDFDTHWTTIFALNSVIYLLHAICTGMLCIAFLAWPFGMCGVIGHGFGVFFHLGAIIITGVFRYSDFAEKCAKNDTDVYYLKDNKDDSFTYEQHANKIEGLFVSACVLFCFYHCFLQTMIGVTRALFNHQRKSNAEKF